MEKILNISGSIIDFIFPKICLVCRTKINSTNKSKYISNFCCSSCFNSMKIAEPPAEIMNVLIPSFTSSYGSDLLAISNAASLYSADYIEDFSIDITENNTEKTTTDIIENNTEKTAIDITENNTEKTAIDVIENNTEKTAIDIIENNTEKTAIDIIENNTEKTAIKLIYGLKYSGYTKIGVELGKLLGKLLTSYEMTSYDYIVPVPIHSAKKRERGFNQTDFIANGVSSIINIPVKLDLLKKKFYTQTQTQLSYLQRKENIKNSFEANSKYDITNKSILLIDDVLTTGSTLNECANILLESSAKLVDIATIIKA